MGRVRSNEWGTHRYEKSLAELGIDARKCLKRSWSSDKIEKIAQKLMRSLVRLLAGHRDGAVEFLSSRLAICGKRMIGIVQLRRRLLRD